MHISQRILGISLLSIAVILTFIYYPGLSGPFLFDDFGNLGIALTAPETINFERAIDYIFGNTSGPAGRPVAMLSFLLNALVTNEPLLFKLTNLFLHACTGILVFLVFKRLIGIITPELSVDKTQLIALSLATLWLCHPLNISTTLYVIQRMTILSGLFSLLSIWLFLKSYPKLSKSDSVVAFLLPGMLISVTSMLALLSKENAILIFPLMLLIHMFSTTGFKSASKLFNLWVCVLASAPLIVLTGWLLKNNVIAIGYESQSFTLTERLLTQSRIIVDYLSQITLPDISTMSLHHDDFIVSKSLFEPLTTLLSVSLLFILAALSFNQATPKLIRFGILWFFVWHLLESTVLPLDLYFEHRNYMAMLGIILCIIVLIIELSSRYLSHLKSLPVVALSLLVVTFSFQTHSLANKWSSEETLYLHWLEGHQQSESALLNLVQFYETNNQLPLARQLVELTNTHNVHQSSVAFKLKQYIQECVLSDEGQNQTLNTLATISREPENYTDNVISMHAGLAINIVEDRCKPTSPELLFRVLTDMTTHAPQMNDYFFKSDMLNKQGFVALKFGAPAIALERFKMGYLPGKIDIGIAIVDLSLKLERRHQAEIWLERVESDIRNNNGEAEFGARLETLKSRF